VAARGGRVPVKIKVIVALLVLWLLTVPAVQSQQQNPRPPIRESVEDVIRVDTTLVTLPVKVTGRQGKVAYGLKRNQFRVFENGVEQEIAYFEAPEAVNDPGSNSKPLTVALMLDISDSTQFKLTKIQSAALTFIDLLRAGDRVLVVSFDKQAQILSEATEDRNVLRESIKRIKTGGGTGLYGALDEIINRHLLRVIGRKAIVLLTDGVDTTSKDASFDSSIRSAETSDVAIFPVQYHTYTDFSDNPSRETYTAGSFGSVSHVTKNGEFASEAYKRATLYLRLLADKTAGHFQFADSAKNLARSFETIATQLREQYTLGYYPKSKVGERRQIEVKVLVPDSTVRTRKTYIYRSRQE
jgi:Ca-activated chloride channel homolog